jgi:alpha-beta hydrolase superfamily lysophospholipase
MTRTTALGTIFVAAIVTGAFTRTLMAQTPLPGIGVVIMHGKGGSPTRHVSSLAFSLEQAGCVVANIEMPWSGNRQYDVDVAAAEKEVNAALDTLRDKGAGKLFVAGHSQGALFALYVGGRLSVDGVIAIAPGGNVASPIFLQNLGTSVELARKLIAEGERQRKGEI